MSSTVSQTAAAPEAALRERMARIESLVEGLGALPEGGPRDLCEELVQTVLEVHGAALARIVALLGDQGEPGRRTLDALAADEIVAPLLLLHDLHPVALSTRIEAVLPDCRTLLAAHGGDVEVAAVKGRTVRLRVLSREGLPPSTLAAMRPMLERVLLGALPDLDRVEIEGLPQPPPPLRPLPVVSSLPVVARP